MNRHNKGCQHYFDDTKMHNVVAKVDSGIERDAPPPLGKNFICFIILTYYYIHFCNFCIRGEHPRKSGYKFF